MSFVFKCRELYCAIPMENKHKCGENFFILSMAVYIVTKFSEGPTISKGTDDTTLTLYSVRPHDTSKIKCTARIIRSCSYVMFTPPQLS